MPYNWALTVMMIWIFLTLKILKTILLHEKNGLCYELCVICKKQHVYSIILLKDINTVLFACWNKDRLRVMVKYSEAPKTNQNVVNLFSLQSIKVVKQIFIFFIIVYMTDSCPLPHPTQMSNFLFIFSEVRFTCTTNLQRLFLLPKTWKPEDSPELCIK